MAKSSANKSSAQQRAGITTKGVGPSASIGPVTKGGKSVGGTGTIASTGPAYSIGATNPTAAQLVGPTVQPFLTAAQQSALTAWNVKYADDLSTLQQNDTTANTTYSTDLAADTLKNAQSGDLTNQSMAARGMFQSSIRDNALNDLATTLAQQQNILQTTRDSALFKDQNDRTTEGAQNTAEQSEYNGYAVTNAQGVTPTPSTAAPVGSPNQINLPTMPTVTPAAQQPPVPTGPAIVQPMSSSSTVKSAKQRVGPPSGTAKLTTAGPKPPSVKINNSGGSGV